MGKARNGSRRQRRIEAGLTGERTRAALAQAKKRGVRLGNPRLSEVAGKGAGFRRNLRALSSVTGRLPG